MEHKKAKITQFQKLVLTGISLVAVLLVVLIVVFSLGRSAPAIANNNTITGEPITIPEQQVKPQTKPEATPDETSKPKVTGNTADDNKSMGTRVGEIFLIGSNKAFNFLSDFNDVVNVTGFFKGGYLEFYDAVRADSGEELIELTVDRIAKNNNVTVLEIEIIYETDSVSITLNSDNETTAENFRRDLEKLSFVSEANYASENINDDGIYVYEIIMVISG